MGEGVGVEVGVGEGVGVGVVVGVGEGVDIFWTPSSPKAGSDPAADIKKLNAGVGEGQVS